MSHVLFTLYRVSLELYDLEVMGMHWIALTLEFKSSPLREASGRKAGS